MYICIYIHTHFTQSAPSPLNPNEAGALHPFMTYLRESLSRYFFQLLKGKNPPPPLIPPKPLWTTKATILGREGVVLSLPPYNKAHAILVEYYFYKIIFLISSNHCIIGPLAVPPVDVGPATAAAVARWSVARWSVCSSVASCRRSSCLVDRRRCWR